MASFGQNTLRLDHHTTSVFLPRRKPRSVDLCHVGLLVGRFLAGLIEGADYKLTLRQRTAGAPVQFPIWTTYREAWRGAALDCARNLASLAGKGADA